MQCPPEESLMDAAKETGQHMYSSMPHDERVEKINLMVSILEHALLNSVTGAFKISEKST